MQIAEAQGSLEDMLEQLHYLYDYAPVGYLTLDKQGVVQRLNLTAAAMFGIERGYFIGTYLVSHITYAYQPVFLNHLKSVAESLTLKSCELELRKKDCSLFWVRMESIRDDRESGEAHVSSAIIDITEQKKVEKQLNKTQESLRLEAIVNAAIAEISLALIYSRSVVDISSLILHQAKKLTQSTLGFIGYINSETSDLIGYAVSSDVLKPVTFKKTSKFCEWLFSNKNTLLINDQFKLHTSFFDLPKDHPPISRFVLCPIMMSNNNVGAVVLANSEKDYSDKDKLLIEKFAQLYTIAIQRKIAEDEKESLEIQLRQAQKMEAIGTLAGGITHDFNNILFPIMGYAQMTMDYLPEGSLARSNIEQILIAAQRAKALVQQILTFSRRGEPERKPLNLVPLIKEIAKLLRSAFPATIDICQKIRQDCGYIMADPAQIHQILMNLCANSYHAMRENGGLLTLGLDQIDVASEKTAPCPKMKSGYYLKLIVSDTGYGMTQEVRERVFEPFFTTKKIGEGTGMGLAVVLGIVKSHEGYIAIDSEPGKYSEISIYLPMICSDETDCEVFTENTEPEGHENILLLDDENQITEMLEQLLRYAGYQVMTMTSPEDTLEFFKKSPESIDLVITDMTMPKMTGLEVARRLKAMRDDIPIILMSGYSESINEESLKNYNIAEYLIKPVVKKDILKSIRRILDNK